MTPASALVVVSPEQLEELVVGAVRRALAEARPVPAKNDDKRLVGVKDAAKRLGMSAKTLYKRAASVEIPSVKDGRLLFRIADLDAYAEAHRRSPELVWKRSASLRVE